MLYVLTNFYLEKNLIFYFLIYSYVFTIKIILGIFFQSGAILAVVGYFALSHPDEKLSVIFIPNVQFDAIYVSSDLSYMSNLLLTFMLNNEH